MRWFFGRLTVVIAVAFVSMAAAVIATPGISSADCDPNMSCNVATWECKPQPAPPAWYATPPHMHRRLPRRTCHRPLRRGHRGHRTAPMWSAGYHQWGIYVTRRLGAALKTVPKPVSLKLAR